MKTFFPYRKNLKSRTVCILILLIICLGACRSEKSRMRKDLAAFTGTCISYPDNLVAFNLPDSAGSRELLERKNKIIIFIDSAECNECRVRMLRQGWIPFLAEISQKDFSCIIIFNTDDFRSVGKAMENHDLHLPYFLDIGSRFKERNPGIHINPRFKTFLTRNDTVILAGDPTASTKFKELYLKAISRE